MFLQAIAEEEATGTVAEVYAKLKAQNGFVMEASKCFTARPDLLPAYIDFVEKIRGSFSLGAREWRLITLIAAKQVPSTYCSYVYSKQLIDDLGSKEMVLAVQRDFRMANLAANDVEMLAYAEKIARNASEVTPADVDRLRQVGFSDQGCFGDRCFGDVVDGARQRHLMCQDGSVVDPSEEPSTMTKITTIGLDIAKNSFAAHGFDECGKTVLTKELKRGQVLAFFTRHEGCRVGLEACASAHHWARELARLGHDVRLIPAARIKAFLPRQKNDAADAHAIARAVRDPEMRFVAVKSVDQQAALMLFKTRELLIGQRTQLLNALRGHFGEIGIVVPKGAHEVHALVEKVMDEEKAKELPCAMRTALRPVVSILFALNDEISALDKAIRKVHRANETSMRLAEVPGIGALIATVLSASVAQPRYFASGREFAAYLGLVPKQHSTGGKARLGSISKMGNRDLRRLLVVGARSALWRMKSGKTRSALADWARRLLEKKSFALVSVALANKMARIAWAIMARGQSYDPAHLSKAAEAPATA